MNLTDKTLLTYLRKVAKDVSREFGIPKHKLKFFDKDKDAQKYYGLWTVGVIQVSLRNVAGNYCSIKRLLRTVAHELAHADVTDNYHHSKKWKETFAKFLKYIYNKYA